MASNDKSKYPVSREALYELAWSQPMASIAKSFDVSFSYLARVYTKLNIPRPIAGYWAKVAAGKPVTQPRLPHRKLSDEVEWDRYNTAPIHEDPSPKSPKRQPAPILVPRLGRPALHPLIRGAKEHFLKTRASKNGYIRPYKWNLVDLIISDDQLDTTLKMANNLFYSLEDYGFEAYLAGPNVFRYNRPHVDERVKPNKRQRYDEHWRPGRQTILDIGDVAVGLTIFEYSEELEAISEGGKHIPLATLSSRKARYQDRWTTTHDFPAGRFCLRAYSPYQGTSWTHHWDFKNGQDMSKFGHKVAKELADQTKAITAQVKKAKEEAEMAHKQWEEQSRKWKIEEIRRQQEKAFKESHEELLQLIDKWGEIKRIESFFKEIEVAAAVLPEEAQSEALERITKARELVGYPNALQGLFQWQSPEEKLTEHK